MPRLAGLLLAFVVFADVNLVAQAGRVGSPAPGFSRLDLGHRRVDLGSYRGKVVLLNFWATWCGPCRVEMPYFVDWQKQYGPARFQVIGMSMDDASPEVVAFLAKTKLNYPVVMGDEAIGAAYGGVLGLPVTFLIDRKGNIRARYQGAIDPVQVKKAIEDLLASGKP